MLLLAKKITEFGVSWFFIYRIPSIRTHTQIQAALVIKPLRPLIIRGFDKEPPCEYFLAVYLAILITQSPSAIPIAHKIW